MFAPNTAWGHIYPVAASMTGDDLLRLPDDGSKNELFEGVLVKEAMTSLGHGIVCQRLGFALGLYGYQTGFPNTVTQNTLFDLTPPGAPRRTVLAPDVAILRIQAAIAPAVTADVPLIAIEVVSPSQTMTELGIKAQFYRNVGVDAVWLIDPEARIAEIWRDASKTALTDADALTSPLLPGFALSLADLFA